MSDNINNFIVRCNRCNWRAFTVGTSVDLEAQGLLVREIKKNCKSCGGPRTFRCMKCGSPAKMLRLKKNG
jgi:hypothetical protein